MEEAEGDATALFVEASQRSSRNKQGAPLLGLLVPRGGNIVTRVYARPVGVAEKSQKVQEQNLLLKIKQAHSIYKNDPHP